MEFPTGSIQPLEAGDPVQVGTYRLLGRLGAGGMGQVFLGVSRGGRQVAVKVLRPDLVADPEFRTRFAREVAAARTVNGFYTAPVVDAAPEASPPWMVTAYVQGPSLAAAVAEGGPLAEPEVRNLAAALAEGLASIHAGGLVHRDLKPANIILASDGPRIIDFGIARAVGASTMTAQGTIIGTFTYMSPEQVKGLAAGPQSDVFSLGSVIVFAATGHGPFEAESLPAITHRILSQPPDLTNLPETLRELVSGCLVRDPKKRYSVEELLTRLEGAGTLPSPPAPGYPETALAVSAPAAPVRPVLTPPPPPLADQRLAPPVRTQTIGSAASQGHPSNPPLPSVLLSSPGWKVTELAFSPDGRLVAGGAVQGRSWRVFLWDVTSRHLVGEPIDGRGDSAPRLAFSPDGRLLVLKELAAARLLNLATRRFLSLSAGGSENSWQKVRFSQDGRFLATAKELRRMSGFTAHQIRLWDSATLQPAAGPFKVDYVAGDSTFEFSPDSRYILVGHESQVFLGDITTSQPGLRKFKDLRGTLGRASFSADGRILAAQHAAGKAVSVFDTAAQTPLATLPCDQDLTRITFSPSSPILSTALASKGREAVELWYLTSSAAAQSWPPPFGGQLEASRLPLDGFRLPLAHLRFSPDGAFLAAASSAVSHGTRAHVRIWAVSNAQTSAMLDLPGRVRITFSPDSCLLAASSADQAVRVVSLQTRSPVNVLPGSNAFFSPTSGLLATTESAGIRLWTLPREGKAVLSPQDR